MFRTAAKEAARIWSEYGTQVLFLVPSFGTAAHEPEFGFAVC